MRVLVTGGAGFVGSNVVVAAIEDGHETTAVVRTSPERPHASCAYRSCDLRDARATSDLVADVRPDVIVHTAILNDLVGIYADRRLAWETYVGTTGSLASAANAVDATLVTVSTDWVFDGTQSTADESTPPNPINYYGVLKAASELVTLERARRPVVARIAGVMGPHHAGSSVSQQQGVGFGDLAAAVVDALTSGEPFVVWEGQRLNMVATPSLASLSSRWMLLLAERGKEGIFHCCGGQSISRLGLSQTAARVFGLDESLLSTGPPPSSAVLPVPVPYDTSLDARETARALGLALPSLHELLERFRDERAALTTA